MKKHWFFVILVLSLALGTVGCAPVTKLEQSAVMAHQELNNRGTIGQTFVAHYEGLSGISIYFEPVEPGDGQITLTLKASPTDTEILTSGSIPLADISHPAFYPIEFSPQSDSTQTYYYMALSLEGSGSVNVGTANGDTYINGALYQNGEPVDAQLSFNLAYLPPRMVLGLLGEGFIWIGYLMVAAFLFVLPGWGILAWALPYWKGQDWASKTALSTGVSLAIYPLLMLWTDVVGLHLGAWYAWLPPIGALASLLWRHREAIKTISISQLKIPKITWPGITLAIVLGVIFSVRFWAIRALEAPMWGDSVQHTAIAQLIFDHRGLFTSWEPIAPYTTQTTHFGFSVFVTLWMWLTKISSAKATLIIGQILNGFAILALYPLSLKFSKGKKWSGIATLIVGGLLSTTPAFYVNWGRYAQLAGQAVIPVAVWLYWQSVRELPRRKIKSILPILCIAGVTVTGMTLSYYRTPFFFSAFILSILLGWGIPKWKKDSLKWKHFFLLTSIMILTSLMLFLPWILDRLVESKLASFVTSGFQNKYPLASYLGSITEWKRLPIYFPTYLLITALFSFLYSLYKKKWIVVFITLWGLFLTLYNLGRFIHLPAARNVQIFAVMIAVYMPLSLTIGWFAGEITSLKIRFPGIIAGISIAVVVFGGYQQKNISDPNTFAMVTIPDTNAMVWIENNTPEQSRFLVQGFRIYNGTSAVGADAGWWIPILTQRSNTMPPQYALLNEVPDPPDYSQGVVDLIAQLENYPINARETMDMLCHENITHIYNGQGQGLVSMGFHQLFNPKELLDMDVLELVYGQDRVQIYQIDQDTCNTTP